MTSKLKCPVCDVPLTECGDLLSCPNDPCGWVGNAALWQALIQAKQDLKIVVDTLKPFADRDNWDFEHCFIDSPQLLAGEALEQINHK